MTAAAPDTSLSRIRRRGGLASAWLDDPSCDTGAERLGVLARYKHGVTLDCHLHEVWLDGLPQPLCVEARADQGWADVLLTDAAGNVVHMLGRPQTHRYYGDVLIRRIGTDAELRRPRSTRLTAG